MTALIAYRSPSGRVAVFRRADGVEFERHEPGNEADVAWSRLGMEGAVMCPKAEWLDRSPSWREEPGDEPEKENETMAKKTTENNEAAVKHKVKRPRAGVWTPVVRRVPIPGTEDRDGVLDVMDVEMYHVEYRGETLEVQRNRAGVKKANDWIRAIKARADLGLKIASIRKGLLTLAETADPETAGRLNRAAVLLIEDVDTRLSTGDGQ